MSVASRSDFLENFRRLNLLKTVETCSVCSGPLHTYVVSRHIDGFAWSCWDKNCPEFKVTHAIRRGSFFEKFRLSLPKNFLLIFCWSTSKKPSDEIKDYSIGRTTVLKVYASLRKIVSNYLELKPIRLGGPGVICEIDESLFVHKVKYNRGRSPRGQVWVFGIVDTSYSPLIGHMEVVEDRSSETLLPIIRRVCKPGTIIHSDMWAGYREIQNRLGFEHYTINHKLNFINPETGVHTQHIESFWNLQKSKIKSMKGVDPEQLSSYLHEFMWKAHNRDIEFESILKLLNKI